MEGKEGGGGGCDPFFGGGGGLALPQYILENEVL